MTVFEMITQLRKLQAEGFHEADFGAIADEFEHLLEKNDQLHYEIEYLESLVPVYLTW